jgi:hypothetical protein
MRKLRISGLIVALLALPTPALAHGGPPNTFTDVMKDFTQTIPFGNPCTGDPGVVTIKINGVFHVTEFADLHVHVSGTSTGTFVFDTTDPSLPDYSGRFTQSFAENGNPNGFNASSTFRVRGTGTDGSSLRFHQTTHLTIVGSDVVVTFDKTSCG